MILIVDTREQKPFSFSKWPEAQVVRAALSCGDYSVPGFEDRVAVERKELNDLVGCCMGQERTRFEKELQRARRYEHFWVVCEGSWEDVSQGRYRSNIKAQSVLQTILAFSIRYNIPFIMAGSRGAAEYLTHGLLSKFLYEIEKRYKTAQGAKHEVS